MKTVDKIKILKRILEAKGCDGFDCYLGEGVFCPMSSNRICTAKTGTGTCPEWAVYDVTAENKIKAKIAELEGSLAEYTPVVACVPGVHSFATGPQPSKWDERFLDLAQHIAQWSKDPSTKCGAVVAHGKQLVSTGYNGFPQGTDDSVAIYADRERKLRRVLHSEENALLFAMKTHADLRQCTVYVWPMPPCHHCMALIIQSGVRRVVTGKPSMEQAERWKESWDEAARMSSEAGVEVIYV